MFVSTKEEKKLLTQKLKNFRRRISTLNRNIKRGRPVTHPQFYTLDFRLFLKGGQSGNPQNDYTQYSIDTGKRAQNFILDFGLAKRFAEYPKLRELIRLKDKVVADSAIPATGLKCDLRSFNLNSLLIKFDVILIDPPLEEYKRTNGYQGDDLWTWEEIKGLNVQELAADKCFLWLWCGSGEGLDEARECFDRWGFRRCEDICWVKTDGTDSRTSPGNSLFRSTKEHCLMGIKGTVLRNCDTNFIHSNIDIDVILDEEAPFGTRRKPEEIYSIIEHFCLGRRRVHLFGDDGTLRPGWVTLGRDVSHSNYDTNNVVAYFPTPMSWLTGSTEDIEQLRPKSPSKTPF